MENKIDIHKRTHQYEREVRRLEADTTMNPRDKELMLKFVWDCKMGKTLSGKSRKKVGEARILKYIQTLRVLSGWVGKPFEEVTQEDMEKLVYGIEENVYKRREENYSEETKADYKKALRKFYKWLGKPGLVEFISLTVKPKDVPALKREEAEALVNSTPHTVMKAAVIVLFDGGLRIEEFLNLRNKDLTKEKYNENNCYWIDIRYSKTFARKIPLPLCNIYLEKWVEEHPSKKDPEAQIFPFTYAAFRKRLRSLAEKALKKSVYPHMLRHSSATYWAARMNRYQLCAKYGWAFSSDMPDRYIERKGIIFNQIAEKGDIDQTTRIQKENRDLMEKMETLEREYGKVKKVVEFIMPLIENMDEDFRKQFFEKRKKQIITGNQYLDNPHGVNAET
jgi:integrase